MARNSFNFLIIMVISALLLLPGSRARFQEKITLNIEDGSESGIAKEIVEAEAEALLRVGEQAMLEQVMTRGLEDNLRCIPCGQNCISSRNCCSPCKCNFGPPTPVCAR